MRVHAAYLLISVFMTVWTTYFGLMSFARLSIATNDTKEPDWLTRLAYVNIRGGEPEGRERLWVRPFIMMLLGGFTATIAFVGLFN